MNLIDIILLSVIFFSVGIIAVRAVFDLMFEILTRRLGPGDDTLP